MYNIYVLISSILYVDTTLPLFFLTTVLPITQLIFSFRKILIPAQYKSKVLKTGLLKLVIIYFNFNKFELFISLFM